MIDEGSLCDTDYKYGKQLDKQYSAAVFKWYSGSKWYFRAFIVNHRHDGTDPGAFDLEISDGNWDIDWESALTNGSDVGLSNGCHLTGNWDVNDYYSIIEVSDDTQ